MSAAHTIDQYETLRRRLKDPKLTNDQREAAQLKIAKLERTRIDLEDRAWIGESIDETVKLAETREEEVSRDTRRTRIKSRDPLLSMLEHKQITDTQYATGVKVISFYETRSGDIGSQMGNLAPPTSSHNNDAFVWARRKRAEKTLRLGMIERRVAAVCHTEPAALQMLRWVCEQGQTIRSFVSGRAYDRHVKALALALDAAAISLTEPLPKSLR